MANILKYRLICQYVKLFLTYGSYKIHCATPYYFFYQPFPSKEKPHKKYGDHGDQLRFILSFCSKLSTYKYL